MIINNPVNIVRTDTLPIIKDSTGNNTLLQYITEPKSNDELLQYIPDELSNMNLKSYKYNHY